MGVSGTAVGGGVSPLLDENIVGFGIRTPVDFPSAAKFKAKTLPIRRTVKNCASAGESGTLDRQVGVRVCDRGARARAHTRRDAAGPGDSSVS